MGRFEEKLKSHLRETTAIVKVRDVMVTCPQSIFGEFKSHVKDHKKLQALIDETTSSVITRIVAHITDIAEQTKHIHLKDNFNNPDNFHSHKELYSRAKNEVPTILTRKLQPEPDPTLDPEVEARDQHFIWKIAGSGGAKRRIKRNYKGERELDIRKKIDELKTKLGPLAEIKDNCLNNITRVSFNEFYFYPYHSRGGLLLADYKILVKLLTKLAERMPENMHMLISSVPVIDEDSQCHNMAMYIQCGQYPIINSFAKAAPSSADPEYIDTSSPFFSGGAHGRRFYKNIKALYMDLKVRKGPITSVDLMKIEVLAESNKEFYAEYVDPKNNLKQAIEKLNRININSAITPGMKSLFIEILKIYLTNIKLKYNAANRKVTERIHIRELPMAVLPLNSKSGLYYGGLFECTTAGHAKFTVVVDICRDFGEKVGDTHLLNFLRLANRDPNCFVSDNLDHIVTSDFISLGRSLFINQTIVHVDTKHHTVVDKSQITSDDGRESTSAPLPLEPQTAIAIKKMSNCIFGSKAELRVFPIREVAKLENSLLKFIQRHNNWVIQLKVAYSTILQHPEQKVIIEKSINTIHFCYAVETLDEKRALELLQLGVDLNVLLQGNETALHRSIRMGMGTLMAELLDRNASVNIPNNEGNTILHLAYFIREKTLILALMQVYADVDVNIKNKQGNTILHLVCDNKDPDLLLAAEIVKRDADIFVEDNAGNTAATKILSLLSDKDFFKESKNNDLLVKLFEAIFNAKDFKTNKSKYEPFLALCIQKLIITNNSKLFGVILPYANLRTLPFARRHS